MAQYIYTMNRVSKVVPPNTAILRDISLSFFPGAKIGVLGFAARAPLSNAPRKTLGDWTIRVAIATSFDVLRRCLEFWQDGRKKRVDC